MRTSSHRHPVAVLRTFLQQKVPEFSELVGCSISTIQSVELGSDRMRLSYDVANAITQSTGVCMQWLIDGNPNAPMIDRSGNPYTAAAFKRVRSGKRSPDDDTSFLFHLQMRAAHVFKLLAAAAATGNVTYISGKMEKALDHLASKHGMDTKAEPSWISVQDALSRAEELATDFAQFRGQKIRPEFSRRFTLGRTPMQRLREAVAEGAREPVSAEVRTAMLRRVAHAIDGLGSHARNVDRSSKRRKAILRKK